MATSDGYLAKPSGLCCLKGTFHEGQPKGRFDTVKGIKTYFAEPKPEDANGNIVIVYPDVFSLSNNLLLILDAFAEAGYLTVALDYFMGDPINLHMDESRNLKPGFDFEAWKTKHMTFAQENTNAWLAEVRTKLNKPDAKYVCTGYCFGAPFVCDSLATEDFVAGSFAHPAFLKEEHFRNIKSELSSIFESETDHTFGAEQRRRSIDILQEDKKHYHVQLFSGVAHGFALRCDLKDPYQRWTKEQSFKGSLEYFNLWTSK